jgi:hypothetical protein
MNGVRKTIAVLILIFIGIPTLIGIIWAVGVTREVVSPEFVSYLQKDIIEKVPNILDETVKDLNREHIGMDKDTKAWVRAVGKVKTSPKELLDKIGATEWMKNDLSSSLEEIRQILRGEAPARSVMLNLRPLKEALKSEKLIEYMRSVVSELPPCTEDQLNSWADAAGNEHSRFPACRPPDMDKTAGIVRLHLAHKADNMPDEVDIFKVDTDPFFRHRALNFAHIVSSLTFLLFLIPLVMIGLASIIATSSGPGILRWMGVSSIIGGGIAFILSKIAEKTLEWGVDSFPFSHSYSYHHATYAEKVFVEKFGGIFSSVLDRIFTGVDHTAGIVCIVGIILIALSYVLFHDKKSTPVNIQKPTPTPPTQPQPENTIK